MHVGSIGKKRLQRCNRRISGVGFTPTSELPVRQYCLLREVYVILEAQFRRSWLIDHRESSGRTRKARK